MTPEGKERSYKLPQQEGDYFFIFKRLLGNSCEHVSISNIQASTKVEDQQGLQASGHKQTSLPWNISCLLNGFRLPD